MLPLCQRCVGLYAGACLAGLLLWFARPRMSGRFLWIHGLFLLCMVPLGFHWVAQGPFLRAVSGVAFGAGLVTFLSLPMLNRTQSDQFGNKRTDWCAAGYWTGLVTGAGLVVWAGGQGGEVLGGVLVTLALGGLGVLAFLVAGQVALATAMVAEMAKRRFRKPAAL